MPLDIVPARWSESSGKWWQTTCNLASTKRSVHHIDRFVIKLTSRSFIKLTHCTIDRQNNFLLIQEWLFIVVLHIRTISEISEKKDIVKIKVRLNRFNMPIIYSHKSRSLFSPIRNKLFSGKNKTSPVRIVIATKSGVIF